MSNKVGPIAKLFLNFWIFLINIGKSESRANRCKKLNLLKYLEMKINIFAYICTCVYILICVNAWKNVSVYAY